MTTPAVPLGGRYLYKSKIEAGTKAPTWLATDQQTGKDVVATSLAPARVAALMGVVGLKHAHLAAIVDVVDSPEPDAMPAGTPSGAAVVVAEHVGGKTLHQALKTGRLTPAEAVTLWIRLCQAASALHASGGAHGAISPRSIVVEPSGGRPGPVLTQLVAPTSGAYCAPERLQGRGPSSADDAWALHAVLFAALTGSPPFRGDTKDQLLQSIVSGQIQKLVDFGVRDATLQDIVEAGLVANLARRRGSVDPFIEALERWEPASEGRAAAAEWEEDLATVVASESEALAAVMLDSKSRGAAGPSLPPVAVSDEESPAAAPPPAARPPVPTRGAAPARSAPHAAPAPVAAPTPPASEPAPRASEAPSPFDDEDDATMIMGHPGIADIRTALAAPSEPPAPAAPMPEPQAASAMPYDATPSPAHYAAPAVPYDATPAPAPYAPLQPPYAEAPAQPQPTEPFRPAQPLAQPGFPPMGAYPIMDSAYPPTIPGPAPTGIPMSSGGMPALDDVEFRSASRRPIMVIIGVVILVVIGIALLLFLNHRGVITTAPTPTGSKLASITGAPSGASSSATLSAASASPQPAPSASVASQGAPATRPATATPDQRSRCVARHFDEGTFKGSEDMGFLCNASDFRGVNSQLYRRLVVAGAGKITPGMREWSTMGWFELAATAVVRAACCPTGTADPSLPETAGDCAQLSAALRGVAKQPFAKDEAEARAGAYEDAVVCLFKKGIPRPYNYWGRPTSQGRRSFQAFFQRAAERAPS